MYSKVLIKVIPEFVKKTDQFITICDSLQGVLFVLAYNMLRNRAFVPMGPPVGLGANSPRFNILAFFLIFTLTVIAVKVWMIIIDEEKIYLEIAGALVTLFFVYLLYLFVCWRISIYRQRVQALREVRRSDSDSEEVDLEEEQLRIQLRRLYGETIDIDTFLQRGLPWETINSCLRYFTYKGKNDLNANSNIGDPGLVSGTDIEEGKSDHGEAVGGIDSGGGGGDDETGLELRDTKPATGSVGGGVSGVGGGTIALQLHADDCAVCLSDFTAGDALVELPCKHVYHQECITHWLLTRNACPLCKQCVVKLSDLRRLIDNQLLDQQAPAGAVPELTNASSHSAGGGGSSHSALMMSTFLRTAFIAEEEAVQQQQQQQHQQQGQSQEQEPGQADARPHSTRHLQEPLSLASTSPVPVQRSDALVPINSRLEEADLGIDDLSQAAAGAVSELGFFRIASHSENDNTTTLSISDSDRDSDSSSRISVVIRPFSGSLGSGDGAGETPVMFAYLQQSPRHHHYQHQQYGQEISQEDNQQHSQEHSEDREDEVRPATSTHPAARLVGVAAYTTLYSKT